MNKEAYALHWCGVGSQQLLCWLQLPQWVPLSVVKGGQAANLLVQQLQSGWGMKLFGNTLVRNIGQVVYKVCH